MTQVLSELGHARLAVLGAANELTRAQRTDGPLAPEYRETVSREFDVALADYVAAATAQARADLGEADPTVGAKADPSASLTSGELAMLAFEQRYENHGRRDGGKDQAIADTFGLTTVAYYQQLNRLIDHPTAIAHWPLLVNRLRRIRADRMSSRSS